MKRDFHTETPNHNGTNTQERRNWGKIGLKRNNHGVWSIESRIVIGQRDDVGTFTWCRSNETVIHLKSFLTCGRMSAHIEILDNFIISYIENWFDDYKVIFFRRKMHLVTE